MDKGDGDYLQEDSAVCNCNGIVQMRKDRIGMSKVSPSWVQEDQGELRDRKQFHWNA